MVMKIAIFGQVPAAPEMPKQKDTIVGFPCITGRSDCGV